MDNRDRLIKLIQPVLDCVPWGQVTKYTAQEIADALLEEGAIVPPCKVGDTLCILLEDDFPAHRWFISEERVTEVGTRGVWTSGYDQPRDDMGSFWDYADMGTEWFTDRVDAEAALKAKEGAE